MKESANTTLNKPLRKEVETLDLYWFTQPELRSILLYSVVKGSTNQNLITEQIFRPTTLGYTSILNTI